MGACDSVSYVADHKVDPIRYPLNGDSMAPWVKLWFKDEGSENDPAITVGNESCPVACIQPHSAVIKSFEYGYTDGIQCKVEILDEEGGAMEDIASKLNKCINKASTDYKMQCQWGWVVVDCMKTQPKVIRSPILTFLPMNIEIFWSKGAIRYTITAVDLLQAVFASRKTETYGTDLHRRKLKEVLPEMFEDREPQIQFRRARRQGKAMLYGDDAYKWKDIDEVGAAWTSDGQSKLGTAIKWTENFRTEHDKGTVPFWMAGADSPTICFVEAGGQDCTSDPGEMEARSVGTFIVNGGKCSPVIDFTPNINWVAAFAQMAAGGQAGAPITGEIVKRDNDRPAGCSKLQSDETGLSQDMNPSRQVKDAFGYTQSTDYIEQNQKENEKAQNISNMTHPIQAELRIQGDPSAEFCIFQEAIQRTCAIVAINPWHLRRGSGKVQGCPSWLVRPPCNQILTNKFWWIFGFNHQIKEGSYVTTLKLRLDAPGIDLNPGEPQGGDPASDSCGKVPGWTNDAC